MSASLLYLIKISVGLAFTAVFYHAFLRRLTFYDWNRWYLLIYPALCFLIPFIDINPAIESFPVVKSTVIVQHAPHLLPESPAATNLEVAPATTEIDYNTLILIAFAAGVMLLAARLLVQWFSFLNIRRSARLVSAEDVHVYEIDEKISPFSFGNAVFYNPEMHTEQELKSILLHEYIHIRQLHSVDMCFAELLCILNWYNPFAWLIRNAIRQNLEYIADRYVLRNNVDPKAYQYLLLKVAGAADFPLASNFSFSSLKERILMINRKRSHRLLLTSFLFALPLLAALLLFFRERVAKPEDEHNDFVLFANPRAANPGAERQKRPAFLRDHMYTSGLLLEYYSGKPLANVPLRIMLRKKLVKVIHTDANGFFYEKLPVLKSATPTKQPKNMKGWCPTDAFYHVVYNGPAYHPFDFLTSDFEGPQNWGSFQIIFEKPKTQAPQGSFDYYGFSQQDFFATIDHQPSRGEVFKYLAKQSYAFLEEHRLKLDFQRQHPFPKGVLTKFKNGYFDREKQLVGYEEFTNLFLDGKPATHEEINKAFAGSPYQLAATKEQRVMSRRGICSQISYITFDQYKSPPPAALLRANVEWKDVNAFDLADLNKIPYFLDGFRQSEGTGSNLIPEKQEIRKIALFKGRLARYYDPRCEEILWIETRPEAEVFERPELVAVN